MDRKSLIILGAAVVVLWGMFKVVDYVVPPPKPAAIPPMEAASVQPAVSNTVASSNAPATSSTAASAPAVATPKAAAASEEILTVSNADLICQFTSRGGGLKDVALRGYPMVLKRGINPATETNLACFNQNAAFPVLGVVCGSLVGDDDYTLTRNGATVRAEKLLGNGLRVVKEFQLETNYLVRASVRVENTSNKPLSVPSQEVIVGTASAIGPLDDPTAIGTYWYNGIKAQDIDESWFANHALGCAILPGKPRSRFEGGASNVVWTAIHNRFFTLAVMPTNPAPELVITKIAVPPPDMSGPTNAMTAYLTNGYFTSLDYPATNLAPGQSTGTAFLIYAGPKNYELLSKLSLKMGNNLDAVMDFGMWGFFSKLLLWSMNRLHNLGMIGGHDFMPYGMTIIAITVIIKLIFWPLTNASTKSQKRMQAFQPQLKAITEKYKDDAVKRNEKTMEFYKLHKVNPLGSCLPTMLQLPVFFGFYYMLRGAIELRGAHFLWAFDLSQPDTVGTLSFLGGFPVNPLPLIMGATQLWQAHMMPPSPGMDPGQQKMMRYMPLLMIAFFYRMAAGLTLYWTVSNLLSILQLRLTSASGDPAAVTTPVTVKKKM